MLLGTSWWPVHTHNWALADWLMHREEEEWEEERDTGEGVRRGGTSHSAHTYILQAASQPPPPAHAARPAHQLVPSVQSSLGALSPPTQRLLAQLSGPERRAPSRPTSTLLHISSPSRGLWPAAGQGSFINYALYSRVADALTSGPCCPCRDCPCQG